MDTERIKEQIEALTTLKEDLLSQEARELRGKIRDLEILLILSWLWMCPLASAKDLEGLVDLFTLPKINSLLDEAVDAGLVVCVRQGRTYSIQRRFFLDLRGVYRVRDHYHIPLAWQVTEEGVKRLVHRLRKVEAFYRVLPGLWRSGALEAPQSFHVSQDPDSPPIILDDQMRLIRFQWVRQGPTHAVAWYRTIGGHVVWVPVHWYGFHHTDKTARDETIDDDLAIFSQNLGASGDFWSGRPACPPGLIIVAIDIFAAFKAKMLYPPARDAAIVTPEGWLSGYMKPRCPMGSVNGTGDRPGRLGRPARVTAWLETPKMSAMNGVTNRKVLEWVESWPGSLAVDIAEGVGQPRSKIAEVLETLKIPLEGPSKSEPAPQHLVQEMEKGRLYLGAVGLKAASRRDRCSYQTANSPLGSYLNPKGHWRKSQMDHNRRVSRLAVRFQRDKESMFVAPGWRLVINYPDETQLAPDLWLEVPWKHGRLVWHCVEYEQSATDTYAIDDKLNNYRIAMREMRAPWPMLMICKTIEAAELFGLRGDDLPMLVAVYDEVVDPKGHGFRGEASVWRYRGAQVDIDPLVHLLLEEHVRV